MAQDVHLVVWMATLALAVIVLLAAWINQAKLSGTQETLLAKVSIAKVLTVIYVLMIYEINHIWTAQSNEDEEMIVAVNAIYAIA